MQHLRSFRSVLAGSIVLVAAAVAGAQTTWYVDVNGAPPGMGTPANPYTSIQYAISRTSTVNGDTLLVAPGEYVENVNTQQKNLTLRASGGPLVTTIRAAQTGTGVLLNGVTKFEGFTVTGHVQTFVFQGAIYAAGDVTISRCIVRDNNGVGIMSVIDAYAYRCTVTGNTIGVRTPGSAGFIGLESCIVTFNGTDLVEDSGSAGLVTSWCVVGPADPGFWNYDERNLRLRPGSIAIDAGNPMTPDPDFSPADAGALTYDPTYAPAPTAYCAGKLNSQGCTPSIGAIGTASATATGQFTITATQLVDHKNGLLFFGFGPRSQPFQGGLHCVALPTKRVGLQNSGGAGPCSGTFAFDMRSYIQSGVHQGLVPGAMVYCQWWSRDPLDPAGFGTSLTNALSLGIAP